MTHHYSVKTLYNLNIFVSSLRSIRVHRIDAVLSDVTACGAGVPRRSDPSSRQVGQGNKNTSFFTRRLHAGALQHWTSALSSHVHIFGKDHSSLSSHVYNYIRYS